MSTASLNMANHLTVNSRPISMDNSLHNSLHSSQGLDSIKQVLLTRQPLPLSGHRMFSRFP
jgi:hypothetical protein